MLYTFSQSDYPLADLEAYCAGFEDGDAVVLWQNGVLLALKYPHLFPQSYALESDVLARGLGGQFAALPQVRLISLAEFVALSESYFPQLAL